jgi:hypothetical protein
MADAEAVLALAKEINDATEGELKVRREGGREGGEKAREQAPLSIRNSSTQLFHPDPSSLHPSFPGPCRTTREGRRGHRA